MSAGPSAGGSLGHEMGGSTVSTIPAMPGSVRVAWSADKAPMRPAVFSPIQMASFVAIGPGSVLAMASASGFASFLTVIKEFGDRDHGGRAGADGDDEHEGAAWAGL